MCMAVPNNSTLAKHRFDDKRRQRQQQQQQQQYTKKTLASQDRAYWKSAVLYARFYY